MRKDLKNRLSRLEQRNKVDIFKTAIVRGNSPEEQAAEVKRLRRKSKCARLLLRSMNAHSRASEFAQIPK